MNQDAQRRAAAEAAAAIVEDGMIVGLGTGSTAAHFIDALIRRVRDEGLKITAIPTSKRSDKQARDGGNYILDCTFGDLSDPAGLEQALSQTIGVVESGLFIGMADMAFVANAHSVKKLTRA